MRVLVYWPDRELWDQLASTEAPEFFDQATCPPWETWIGWIDGPWYERHLLAVVPQPLIQAVDSTVNCATADQIAWLEQTSLAERAALAI